MGKIIEIEICPREKYAYSKRWKVHRPHAGCKARTDEGLCRLHEVAKLGVDKGYLHECEGRTIRCVAPKKDKRIPHTEHYGKYLDGLFDGDVVVVEKTAPKQMRLDMGIFGDANRLIQMNPKPKNNTYK